MYEPHKIFSMQIDSNCTWIHGGFVDTPSVFGSLWNFDACLWVLIF